jgi:hypothetical protein
VVVVVVCMEDCAEACRNSRDSNVGLKFR